MDDAFYVPGLVYHRSERRARAHGPGPTGIS